MMRTPEDLMTRCTAAGIGVGPHAIVCGLVAALISVAPLADAAERPGDAPPSDAMPMAGRFEPGPRPGFGPPPFQMPPPELLEQLKLSDAQRTKLGQMRDAAERKAIPIEADLRIAELDLRRAAEGDTPDRPALDAAIDRIGSLRTTLLKSRVASWIEMRSVLTPAQRARLRELGLGTRHPR
jgi:Spy/CpxP family protein refolding chaperone